MADKQGKLSQEEKQRIRDWLVAREAKQPCPICGHNQWAIGDTLALAQQYVREGGLMIGAGYPAAVVLCQRCTFMRWHSAIAIGLVPSDGEREATAEGVKNA